MEELAKQYSPKDVEDKWYKYWQDQGFFKGSPCSGKKPYSIVIPPPNVTGILHMGHALNESIQDILIRYHHLRGFQSLMLPGTDHAGIATQNVVEKSIAKLGLTRQKIGRAEFIKRVWLWKEEYGSTIVHQLKKLGVSCDWSRERFTMDDEYSEAVKTVFVALWEKGLIYQGNKVINWCPRCQTALSDEEAPHNELQGSLYYIKYPLKEPAEEKYLVVATTRPETMLGDTAVAVNPKDKRYKNLIGKSLVLPLCGRQIKIIADHSVDMQFGTGAVKITPAHDFNDYITGKKHNLEFINLMHPDGRMNENAGNYNNLDRFKAREIILHDLQEQGLLEKIEPHQLSAGHCYRCHTIIEPYLCPQWFVKMAPLAKPAIKAVKQGKIKFHPERWTKVYLNWMENIQDWCISRQIWWGHRLPVYYCRKCHDSQLSAVSLQLSASARKSFNGIIVSKEFPKKCPKCGSTDIYQDEDVLDTWFSSWLWPFATFYWPNFLRLAVSGQRPTVSDQQRKEELSAESKKLKADLKYFYPTSTLVTAPEIIFFWVARMIMAGLEFMHQIPFKDVYLHGTVRDAEGKKMSKSLGNIIDPLKIIEEYGTDALRFSLISITAQGQDVFLSKERFEQGRNFANKIWNASRFILLNRKRAGICVDLVDFAKKNKLSVINRWMISRFYSCLEQVQNDLDNFRFNEAANTLYSFFWHEFCDWYLELIKPEINDPATEAVTNALLEQYLRLMHPFMPFITEEIWQKLQVAQGLSIMQTDWPRMQKKLLDIAAENQMQLCCEIITTLRNMRQEIEVAAQDLISAKIFAPDESSLRVLEPFSGYIKNLARLDNLSIACQYQPKSCEYVTLLKQIHIVIPLSGVVDLKQQLDNCNQKILKLNSEIKNKRSMLENKDFVGRAPKEIVNAERGKLTQMLNQLKKIEAIKDALR
ncbi:MAG: valine--tRNA ligase [Candidatus Omnitrophica bacterium]|jgi:valyl-tRNA synthetase|nr:valine--tRNA ligase [Candidatus Omnitrophota bacterium]